MSRRLLGWLILGALMPSYARAAERLPAGLSQVAFEQRLDEQLPMDVPLRDERGANVTLADFCNERPAVLAFAQYRCPMLCNQVLKALAESLASVPLKPGADYQVVVLSFDHRETPEMAAEKKAAYLDAASQEEADAWHFLTADEKAIEAVTKAVGFQYAYDPRQDRFAHASGIVVVAPGGRLARYFLGLRYPPRDLRLALAEASQGTIGSLAERVLLLCYEYDPASGQYTLLAMNLVRVGGIITVAALVALILILLRRQRREGGRPRPAQGPASLGTTGPPGPGAAEQFLDNGPF